MPAIFTLTSSIPLQPIAQQLIGEPVLLAISTKTVSGTLQNQDSNGNPIGTAVSYSIQMTDEDVQQIITIVFNRAVADGIVPGPGTITVT